MSTKKYPSIVVKLAVATRTDGSAVARVKVPGRDGQEITTLMQEWRSGAPTEPQLVALCCELNDQAYELVVMTYGVQGVLLPYPTLWPPE